MSESDCEEANEQQTRSVCFIPLQLCLSSQNHQADDKLSAFAKNHINRSVSQPYGVSAQRICFSCFNVPTITSDNTHCLMFAIKSLKSGQLFVPPKMVGKQNVWK